MASLQIWSNDNSTPDKNSKQHKKKMKLHLILLSTIHNKVSMLLFSALSSKEDLSILVKQPLT